MSEAQMGLYFDYGALVVMGDGRRGGVKGCVCAYKRLALKLQKAWSSHGPGRATALDAARIGLPQAFEIFNDLICNFWINGL